MDVSPTALETLYKTFLSIEVFVQLIALCFSAFFIATMARIRSMHIHLIIVFCSLILSFCFTTISRLRQLYAVLVQAKQTTDDDIRLFLHLRDVGMFAAGLHILFIAVERIIATIRVKTYEKERHGYIMTALVCFVWTFSVSFMLWLGDNPYSRFIAAGLYVFVDLLSIGLMYLVKHKNLKYYRTHRGEMNITHGYQVRENVRTSQFLHKAFLIFALDIAVALAFYLAYSYCVISGQKLLQKIFGFGFDIMVAVSPIVIVVTVVLTHKSVHHMVLTTFCKGKIEERRSSLALKNQGPEIFDLDGKNVNIRHSEETTIYFRQLREAWT